MKKKDIITYLLQCSTILDEDIKNWSKQKHILMVKGLHQIGNIIVSSKVQSSTEGEKIRKLDVISSGGCLANIPLMCKIATTLKKVCPRIWNKNKMNVEEEITREEIMKFIPRDIVQDMDERKSNSDLDHIENVSIQQDSTSEASDSVTSEIGDSKMLQDILSELKKLNKKDIWHHISPRMLLKYYLADAKAISSSFLATELDVLNKIVWKYTG